MWKSFKCLLYDFLVWTGVVYKIFPYVFFRLMSYFDPEKVSNHREADEAGHTLRMVRLDGRNYPIIREAKLRSIKSLKIRSDDVLLCSYPKAGCHWMQEIMHMLVTGKIQMTKLGKEIAGGIDLLSDLILDSVPSPRVMNSHLLYKELPDGVRDKKSKIVLMLRNPKDTVVSFFNYHKNLVNMYGYDGHFDAYFKMFMEGRLEYGSYFDYILDWDTVAKEMTDNPILLITYEDLTEQPMETVLRVATFLKLDVTNEYIAKVINACNFDKMKAVRAKQNETIGKVYRKGQVGDWRNWLTDEQSDIIDSMWRSRMMGYGVHSRVDAGFFLV